MKSRTTFLASVLLSLATSAADAPMPTTTPAPAPVQVELRLDPELLDALISESRTNHPGLRAAEQRARAAEHQVEAVRRWPDPMFRFGGVVANTPGPNLDMEGDLLYEVEQGLPIFGKERAARKEAEAGAAVAGASATYQFQLLRRAIAQALHQLAFADATLRIGSEDLQLIGRMTELARQRQQAGLDSNLDFLRLENELQKRRQQLETDRLQREFERASVNRLLGRVQEAPWPAIATPAVAPAVPLSQEMFELGLKFEPRLQVLRRESAMADAGVESTRRSRRPDVRLGVAGRQWSGSGGFREGMFTVGLNLPWFNQRHYRADLDRDRARASAVEADIEDYALDVRRELFRIWTRLDASRREALLYQESIIPRSELAVQTALGAWSAGRGAFLDVHEARRMLVEARLIHARAINEQYQMIADLVTCCGLADLDSLLMLSPAAAAGAVAPTNPLNPPESPRP